MELTISPEIESALEEQARRQGTTPERLALDALKEKFLSEQEGTPSDETLADFLKDFIGVLDSDKHVPNGPRMSADTGAKFAQGMSERCT